VAPPRDMSATYRSREQQPREHYQEWIHRLPPMASRMCSLGEGTRKATRGVRVARQSIRHCRRQSEHYLGRCDLTETACPRWRLRRSGIAIPCQPTDRVHPNQTLPRSGQMHFGSGFAAGPPLSHRPGGPLGPSKRPGPSSTKHHRQLNPTQTQPAVESHVQTARPP